MFHETASKGIKKVLSLTLERFLVNCVTEEACIFQKTKNSSFLIPILLDMLTFFREYFHCLYTQFCKAQVQELKFKRTSEQLNKQRLC